jgi:hypothetical protein
VESGVVIPLYTFGYRNAEGAFERDPAIPDVPHFVEVYEDLNGAEPSGELWDAYNLVYTSTRALSRVLWTGGETPDDALADIQTALAAMADDPDYVEGIDTVLGGYAPVGGDEMHTLIEEMIDADPDVVDWLIEYRSTAFS